ncbi:MAG TPA: hypothetical protein DCE42_25755 [Myxococcales bacterium]|nr:hypothetical protein [Deltaproteobacteria bacterium]HAA58195.1 hypothetical protein [Myxococcales bacterium]|tara:strand:- start:51518 stop:52381 length:864 start_codon:yes stop_codon:yes gene_type:complete
MDTNMDNHTIEDTHLQAYLHGELAQQEAQSLSEHLQTDAALLQRYQTLQEQDRVIMSNIQLLQEVPTLDPTEALKDFYRHTQAPSKPSWWERWMGDMRASFILATTACAALVMMTYTPSQQQVASHPTPPALRKKGLAHSHTTEEKDVVLQLGAVNHNAPKLKRIGHGDTCRQDDALSFAFHLKSPGYPYLFLVTSKTRLRLYPFSQQQVKWSAGNKQITRAGVVQLYQLKRHRGHVRFVLMKSKEPLSPSTLSRFQRRLSTQQHRSRPNVDVLDIHVQSAQQGGGQ